MKRALLILFALALFAPLAMSNGDADARICRNGRCYVPWTVQPIQLAQADVPIIEAPVEAPDDIEVDTEDVEVDDIQTDDPVVTNNSTGNYGSVGSRVVRYAPVITYQNAGSFGKQYTRFRQTQSYRLMSRPMYKVKTKTTHRVVPARPVMLATANLVGDVYCVATAPVRALGRMRANSLSRRAARTACRW